MGWNLEVCIFIVVLGDFDEVVGEVYWEFLFRNYFFNFNVYVNYLRVLLKCEFLFRRFGVELKFCIFKNFLGVVVVVGDVGFGIIF